MSRACKKLQHSLWRQARMHPAAMREVSEQVRADSGRWMDGAGKQPPAVDGAGRARVELGE